MTDKNHYCNTKEPLLKVGEKEFLLLIIVLIKSHAKPLLNITSYISLFIQCFVF